MITSSTTLTRSTAITHKRVNRLKRCAGTNNEETAPNKRRQLLALTLIIATAIVIVGYREPSDEDQPAGFAVTVYPTHPSQLTTEHYMEDYQHLYSIIETNYPYLALKERTHGANWLDRKEAATEKIRACKDNQEFLEIIAGEVSALQNRHTGLLHPNEVREYCTRYQNVSFMAEIFNDQVAEANVYWSHHFSSPDRRYPVEILYDRGRYIVVNRQGGTATRYGVNLTVTEIDGAPIHDAIKNAETYIDYDHIRGRLYAWAITPECFPPDAVFNVAHPNGTMKHRVFPTVYGSPRTNFYPAPDLITRKHRDQSAAYMYVKTFDPETVQRITPAIHGFLNETRDYRYLIIDIRGNTGGAFHSWLTAIVEPLLKAPVLHEYYLAYRNDPYIMGFHGQWLGDKEPVPKNHFTELPPEVDTPQYSVYNGSDTYQPANTINHTAKRILLTDRTVYSAAEGFTNFCKQTGFATIIGTHSGGDGFFIWPNYVVLPHSKLVVTMTSSMSLDRQGRANEEARTTPDIVHETSITDHELLIEYTLKLIEQEGIP